MSSLDPNYEDEDDDCYSLPFGKISQRARRHDELESQKCNETCKDDKNSLSQDLFHSQIDTTPSDTLERLSRYSPVEVFNTKTKEDTLASHTVQLLPTPASDQQALISGYQVVKVYREGISSVIQSNTFEALPHPTKLFRRRKQNIAQQMSKASQRSLRVKQYDKDNQRVAIHLRQLRLKQSRIDANKESDQTNLSDQISLSRNATNSMTETIASGTVKEKPVITTTISDWEAIESWIHGRWKSNSVSYINHHVEE